MARPSHPPPSERDPSVEEHSGKRAGKSLGKSAGEHAGKNAGQEETTSRGKAFAPLGDEPGEPLFPHPSSTVISATTREATITEAPERTGVRVSDSLIAETVAEGGEAALSDRPTVFRPSSGRLVALNPDGAVDFEPQAIPALEDRIEMLSIVGRGGMGSVHAARDRQLLRTVAVKILNRALVSEQSIVRRFLSEAQVLAQLEHPNIVPFYTLERTGDGSHAFLMRLVEGKTFTQYLQECAVHAEAGETSTGAHSMQSRIEHLLKVCDAIDYSHSRGVIHRDIKPDNLMLGAHNEVYVMDWGIALVMGAPEEDWQPINPKVEERGSRHSVPSVRETEFNQAVGTLSYMSPEQAAGRLENPHPTTDVFALGMVLQEMMTLQPARTSKEPAGLMMAARAGFREPVVHRYGAKIPKGVKAIIETATSPTRRERYSTVAAFADDLRRLARNEELSVMRDGWTTKLWRGLSKRPVTVLLTILAVVLVVSGLAVFGFWQSAETQANSAQHARDMSAVTLAVAHRSQEISNEMARLSALVDELAAATAVMLERPAGGDGGGVLLPTGTLKGATNIVKAEGYNRLVSFEAADFVLGPKITHEQVVEDLAKLAPVQPFMRAVFVQSGPKKLLNLRRHEQNVLLASGVAEFQWAYVGLKDSFLISYPATSDKFTDFHLTTRPWYVSAKEEQLGGTRWGKPYPAHESGTLLVPVSRVIVGQEGEFLGVAGADVTLDDFLNYLHVPELKGWKRSLLVDEQGLILMDSDELGTETPIGVHKALPTKLPKLKIPVVSEGIANESPGGHTVIDDRIVVYSRLKLHGWYYVVFVDANAHAGGSSPLVH